MFIQEARVAESLFLPPKSNVADIDKKLGSRVSRRLQKQHQEKIAAFELEGSSTSTLGIGICSSSPSHPPFV
jgi:hypothetical protein